jgi:putative transcriptional regulator
MDNNLFDDLVASIKEAGAIKRKEVKQAELQNSNYLILKKYEKKLA